MSPNGKNVYVTNLPRALFPSTVSQFNVGAGGTLTPKSPATVMNAGDVGLGLAVSPNGQSVYVANNDSNSISQYNVGSGGRLRPRARPRWAQGAVRRTSC